MKLTRGIYAEAAEDIDGIVLRHAVRIANYLYPRPYLSGASPVLLAPTRDGRLFMSGPRSQRKRIAIVFRRSGACSAVLARHSRNRDCA